jgi:alkylated DNA repair dioxygenase AlkB
MTLAPGLASCRLASLRAEHGTELGEDAWIALVPEVFRDHEATMHALVGELPLAPEALVIYGKDVLTPRLVSFHGEPHAAYGYSGRRFEPRPWTAGLERARETVREATGVRFDCVLVNHYRDGSDAMGWHADDELELGEGSLLVMGGSTQRRFQHAIPRTARTVGPRMNLTFRLIRR